MDLVLIGDIGGTNTRLNLYSLERLTHEYTLIKQKKISTNNYKNLKDVLQEFLKNQNLEKDVYLYGCVAIAGLVIENDFHGANNIYWEPFSSSIFLEDNWFKEFILINDFKAVGYCGELFVNENYYQVNPSAIEKPRNSQNVLIVGIGTGVGVSI